MRSPSPASTVFLSTPSARRATRHLFAVGLELPISIHALREEGDLRHRGKAAFYWISIHALREEGDPLRTFRLLAVIYFYPRPPRGGRLRQNDIHRNIGEISIHALREEGDKVSSEYRKIFCISIHALREEGDFVGAGPRIRILSFLSTPSARRATSVLCQPLPRLVNFYPRPPRGGRHRCCASHCPGW